MWLTHLPAISLFRERAISGGVARKHLVENKLRSTPWSPAEMALTRGRPRATIRPSSGQKEPSMKRLALILLGVVIAAGCRRCWEPTPYYCPPACPPGCAPAANPCPAPANPCASPCPPGTTTYSQPAYKQPAPLATQPAPLSSPPATTYGQPSSPGYNGQPSPSGPVSLPR
jgi:hypothetical protein